ncbi:hypothetical protein HanPI659440_Chr05g0202431 [Helianthus annuus]|nr:hypothetical protein HanPI659440_Chr05g0202431 [Helianthus annuus]
MKDLITPIKDIKGNNMLHMVAKKAKQNQIQNVSGAEVEQLIPPSYRQRKNIAGETPRDLFAKEHAYLISKGKDWMNNYMLVATLIATIVFAAAFEDCFGNQESSESRIWASGLSYVYLFMLF